MRAKSHRSRLGAVAALAALVATLGAQPVSAAPAASPNFSRGGIARGSQRGIVVFGSGFAVARLGLGGQRDPGFGSAGIASASFPGFREYRSTDAYVSNGNQVTVGGYVTERCRPRRGRVCGTRPALARFTAAGKLDRGFGSGGRVVLGGRPGTVRGIAGLRGGGVAIAGRTRSGLPFLFELDRRGVPNRRFGDRGLVIVRALPGAGRIATGRVNRVEQGPGGEIIASFSATGPHLRRIGLLELSPSGTPRRGFAERGFLTTLPAGLRFDEYGFGFATLPNRGVLLAATSDTYSPRDAAVVRLAPDGSPETGYGSDGVASGPAYDVRFNVDLAARPDGGAVLAMAGYQGSALAGIDAGGAVEPGFGLAGLTPPLESWGSRASTSILVDGGAVLADANRQLSALIVARYGPDGQLLFTTELTG